jgi:superfamily II DNA/RNA helicase
VFSQSYDALLRMHSKFTFWCRVLSLQDVKYFVLDEADEMLNMGFQEDVERILEGVPNERQTMLFSATMPQWVRKLARNYCKEYIMVDLVGEASSGAPDALCRFAWLSGSLSCTCGASKVNKDERS